MATTEEIKLIIKAETSKATKQIKTFNKNLTATEKKTKKTSSSLKDLQGGWVAATASMGAAVAIIGKAVGAASELNEVTSKFNTVFGTSKEVLDEANIAVSELTESYAMSTREARQSMASMQDLLKPLGILPEKAGNLSTEIVKLASDMGSFNDIPTADIMNDISSALVGMNRPMMKYGTVLSDATVKQEAFRLKLYSGKAAIDASARAQAALSLIMKSQTDAQGDMIRTGSSYANTMKKMSARSEDFLASIGTPMMNALNSFIQGNMISSEETTKLGHSLGVLGAAIINSISVLKEFASALSPAVALFEYSVWAINKMSDGIESFNKYVQGSSSASKTMTESMQSMANHTKLFSDEVASAISANSELAHSENRVAISSVGSANKIKKANDDKIRSKEDLFAYTASANEKEIASENEKYEKLKVGLQGNKAALLEIEKKHNENLNSIRQEQTDLESEQRMINFEETLGWASQVTSSVQEIYGQYYANKQMEIDNDLFKEKQKLDKGYKQDLKRIKDTIKDDAAQKKAIEALDKEYADKKAKVEEKAAKDGRKLARDQAKSQKKLAIVQATISTAQAVAQALAVPPPPVGIALASMIGGLGAVQIGLIASQELPEAETGGIIKGSASGTALIAGEKNKSEMIVPFENEEAMENMGGSVGGEAININIQNLYAVGDADALAEDLDRAFFKLYQDKNSVFAEALQ